MNLTSSMLPHDAIPLQLGLLKRDEYRVTHSKKPRVMNHITCPAVMCSGYTCTGYWPCRHAWYCLTSDALTLPTQAQEAMPPKTMTDNATAELE